MKKVKFDGKHWIGKRVPKGPLQVHSYNHVVNQALNSLGQGGIVAIPNARPDEYRYEEFHDMAPQEIRTGKNVFYDPKGIYFIKAQEVNIGYFAGKPTFLVYGLPFGENIREGRIISDAVDKNCIIGITGPSCINNLEGAFRNDKILPRYLDFFVAWSGGAKSKEDNLRSLNLYEKYLQEKTFASLRTKEEHKVGVIAVSGGHRCPRGVKKLISGATISTSYVEIPEIKGENFLEELRDSLRNSQSFDSLCTKMNLRETYFRHVPSLLIFDKIRKVFERY